MINIKHYFFLVILLFFLGCGKEYAKSKAGEPCEKDSDCQSNRCLIDDFVGNGSICVSLPGTLCQRDTDCWSRRCQKGRCTEVRSGEPCVESSDCESGRCVKGSTSWPKFLYSCSCQHDSDCKYTTQWCLQGRCATHTECFLRILEYCKKNSIKNKVIELTCDCNIYTCTYIPSRTDPFFLTSTLAGCRWQGGTNR